VNLDHELTYKFEWFFIVNLRERIMEVYAVVHRQRKPRKGRGFSRGELKEVGLSLKQALKLGIQIDPRRSTKQGENVKTLKTYLSKEVPTPEI